jgi:RND family efflux transporter MFP subunit
MKRSKILSLTLAGLLAVTAASVLALAGCAPRPQAAQVPTAVNVGTQTTRYGDVSATVAVTGALAALSDVPLSPKQGGRLIEVCFNNGDAVKAGQVVARIDPTDLLSTEREDEAAVAIAQASLQNAQAAYQKQLTSTQADIDSARAAYNQQVAQSSAEVVSAQSALASAQANLSEVQEGDRPEERVKTQSSLASAQANYDKALADYKRYEKLHNAGAISDQDMDQYSSALKTDQADLDSAKASITEQIHGNRSQDIRQAQEKVRQAEETLRQDVAARATDAVKKANLETALAEVSDNAVKLAEVKSALASVQQAVATLAVARQAVSDAKVVSPFSGVVYSRSADPGQIIASGATLLHVVSLDSVYFEPSAPDTQISAVHVGQQVDVSVDAYPDRIFQGMVTRIYPESSSSSRSVPIRVSLNNAVNLLKPGMYARALIVTSAHRDVVLAPVNAIVDEAGDGSYVYTVENGVAHKRRAVKGIVSSDGSLIEVKGVPAGASLIVDGLTGIADGQRVAATPASADAAK